MVARYWSFAKSLSLVIVVALLCGPLLAVAKPLLLTPDDPDLHLLDRNIGCYVQEQHNILLSLTRVKKGIRGSAINIASHKKTIKRLEKILNKGKSSQGYRLNRGAVKRELKRSQRVVQLHDYCQTLELPSNDPPQDPSEPAPPGKDPELELPAPNLPPSPTPLPTPSPTIEMPMPAPLATTDKISQYGVEFIFDKPYQYGQFANGDFFVVGPVKIIEITPQFTGSRNGFELNPDSPTFQGFDNRIQSFNAARVPSLPLSVSGSASIIKAISLEQCTHACLKTAVVLTVLSAPPAGGGEKYFRPGYAGANKILTPISDLKLDLLPNFQPVGSMPTLETIKQRFQRVWLDHKTDWSGRAMHPAENMPDYGAALAIHTNESALRLMVAAANSEKLPALINYVQYGIDLESMLAMGTRFPPNGGHGLGRLLPLAFAATVLDSSTIKERINQVGLGNFHENGSIVVGQNGEPLWGHAGGEYEYWKNQVLDQASRTIRDPYGYIDGGYVPGGSYAFCCNNQPFKGMALALNLMPDLQQLWNNPYFLEYADRTVNFGTITQPDPCAPHDGNMANYGITFGPDGQGSCIKGPGRYPQLHGTGADSGYYGSGFVNAMWNAYR